MKKIAIIAVVALVVIGCVLVAGCTQPSNQPTDDKNTGADITPAVTIDLKNENKTGSTYAEGEILSITFPSNGTTGYIWKVTQQDKGLDIEENTKAGEAETTIDGKTVPMVGVPGTTTFWISAQEPGTYAFTLKYLRPWEDESTAVATYSDKITVEKKDKQVVNGPTFSVTYDTFNINPKAGEYILIKIPSNATTGYTWKASGDGLKIVNDYKVNDAPEGMVGVPGTTYIYVTADKAGDYALTLEEARSGSDPIVSVTFGVKFL